jgi:hypothetical protein
MPALFGLNKTDALILFDAVVEVVVNVVLVFLMLVVSVVETDVVVESHA